MKQPSEMTAIEAIEAICKYDTEHDLDCVEDAVSDRCTPCLAKAALAKLKGDE